MKKLIYPLLFVCFSIWLIYDDLPYIWMFLHKKQIVQTQGVVVKKYKKARSQVRGGSAMDYIIEIRDINSSCKGISRISEERFMTAHLNDEISILQYKGSCLATFDSRMYAPPMVHFIGAGFVLVAGLVYLITGVRQVLKGKT